MRFSAGIIFLAFLLQTSLPQPVAIYSEDPDDLWNRAYDLLFTNVRTVEVPQKTASLAPQPRMDKAIREQERLQLLTKFYYQRYSFVSGSTKLDRLEGGDMPDFFFDERVEFLMKEPRYGELVDALEKGIKMLNFQSRSAIARVLFQQDLWNRYDAVYRLIQIEKDQGTKTRAERLLSLLGEWIALTVCNSEELQTIQSNFEEIAQAYPQVDSELFEKDSKWRELIVPHTAEQTTSHAKSAGYRRVFRVFVRVQEESGGTHCLEALLPAYFRSHERSMVPCAPDGRSLVRGSRALLMEFLLTLTNHGEIFPMPLLLGVESREIGFPDPGADGKYDLEDLPFQVLHISRQELSSTKRQRGGLKLLAQDELVPALFIAFGRGSALLPVPISCINCHGIDGRAMMTTNLIAVRDIQVVHPANIIQQERVIVAKQKSPDYQSLRKLLVR